MFVDASAIVAILTQEPDAEALGEALSAADAPITSPIAVFEAVLGVVRKRPGRIVEAFDDVRAFLAAANVSVVPITEQTVATALDAFERYGKGQGHPARLNLGDCFAYAVAHDQRVALLFKGDDFGRTDIQAAQPNGPR
jgi:ribonuclease VapC